MASIAIAPRLRPCGARHWLTRFFAVVWRSVPKGALASVAKSLSLEDEVKSHDGQADKAHSMELSRQRSTAVMDYQSQRTASVKRYFSACGLKPSGPCAGAKALQMVYKQKDKIEAGRTRPTLSRFPNFIALWACSLTAARRRGVQCSRSSTRTTTAQYPKRSSKWVRRAGAVAAQTTARSRLRVIPASERQQPRLAACAGR